MSLVHAFQFCNHHSNLQTEAMACRILSLHINKLSNLTLKSKITWVILSTKLRCTDPSRAPSARSSPEGEGRSSPTWMFCPRPNKGGCTLEIQHHYLRPALGLPVALVTQTEGRRVPPPVLLSPF